MRIRTWLLPVLAFSGIQIASADVFTIDADNLTGALCSAATPCGTVTVTGTDVLHVVIALNSPFGIFGNNDAFGFNVVGTTTGVTLNNFSDTSFNGTGGSGNEDGWGAFAFRVDGPGGSSAVSSLSFDVSRTGTAFTGPGDIEAGATGGNGFTVFALHIRDNNSGLTGYAGVSQGPGNVPEPASAVLTSGSLLALCCLLRKRRSASIG